MRLETWWLFCAMTFIVSATPGPNMLLVMASSARHGMRSAVGTMAGCFSAVLAMMILSAAGLGALLAAFPALFDVLRWTGAAYLAYLGLRTWLAPVPAAGPESPAREAVAARPWERFRQGLLVGFSNPKAILFAAAFLPQFIRPDAPALPQLAILLATFTVIEVSWYLVYAASGRRLAQYLRRAPVMRAFNRVTGGVFVGFAVAMAALRD